MTEPAGYAANERDEVVRDILATTLQLARELQRELGRLQQIVDSSMSGGDDDAL
jgi:hypothetical protein